MRTEQNASTAERRSREEDWTSEWQPVRGHQRKSGSESVGRLPAQTSFFSLFRWKWQDWFKVSGRVVEWREQAKNDGPSGVTLCMMVFSLKEWRSNPKLLMFGDVSTIYWRLTPGCLHTTPFGPVSPADGGCQLGHGWSCHYEIWRRHTKWHVMADKRLVSTTKKISTLWNLGVIRCAMSPPVLMRECAWRGGGGGGGLDA